MSPNSAGVYTSEDEAQFLEASAHLREELVSKEIDSNMLYSGQVETVRSCLNEAFGEYTKDIQLTNSFFLDLNTFMSRLKEFQEFT